MGEDGGLAGRRQLPAGAAANRKKGEGGESRLAKRQSRLRTPHPAMHRHSLLSPPSYAPFLRVAVAASRVGGGRSRGEGRVGVGEEVGVARKETIFDDLTGSHNPIFNLNNLKVVGEK